MARIKLQIPESHPVFETKVSLTVNFINYGGHMGNDAILTLCQEARIRYLKSLGFSELNYFGKSIIQADAAIVYKGEGFLGDELTVKLYLDDLNEYGMDFFYLFTNETTGKEIARAKTGIVFFDYEARKISKRPHEVE
ncbi:thioesterase family protein [Bacteriovorax sp. Seq25_V]|uniref:thioesterase family protein n=1 Tax=Bacteriovorax sp. Seq25_V TaxID=1201288 RepID=UPI00038A4D5D|nr:thioesterase family protein [Bacteriovorax sp. Seq25_V]EQC44895.1 thioesterase-like family protein [Bacteriovorax sp. Seq25_V]